MNSVNQRPFPFDWSLLGDIDTGREKLGDSMPVAVYRLFEYTMRDAVSARFGEVECVEVFRDAGRLAGEHFYKQFLSDATDKNDLFAKWQAAFSNMQIGIIRVESLEENGDAVITVSEDLDCSGLPVIGSTVCYYDEGFISGVMSTYSHMPYSAKEVDCWAKGDRVCRFNVKVNR